VFGSHPLRFGDRTRRGLKLGVGEDDIVVAALLRAGEAQKSVSPEL